MGSGHSRRTSRAGATREPSRAARDELTFEQVYRRHVGFVWRSLRSMGVGESALEDATHEVFLVLHRRWADHDRQSKMTTWLYGIARGVANNARRGQARADRKLAAVREQACTASQSGSFAGPSGHVSRKEAAQLVDDFLEELPADQRRVFVMCEVEGMSAPEAARCLDDNVNTVSSRLRRARAQFSRYLRALAGEVA